MGSTTAILNFVNNSDAREFIIGTEQHIIHQMEKAAERASDTNEKVILNPREMEFRSGCRVALERAEAILFIGGNSEFENAFV